MKAIGASRSKKGPCDYREFLERLRVEFKRAERYVRTLSLARVDIDKIKIPKSKFGPTKKKQVLSEISQIFFKNCRGADVVGYCGEQGLAVMLPETNISGAFAFAQRVKEKVASHKFKGLNMMITVSAGTANYPRSAATAYNLIKQANRALRLAKSTGSNRVHGPRAKG